MNIIGILVTTLPGYPLVVAGQIESLGGEVHAMTENGQLVVTLERESDAAVTECITQIQAVAGVLTAAMVYQHTDHDNLNEE